MILPCGKKNTGGLLGQKKPIVFLTGKIPQCSLIKSESETATVTNIRVIPKTLFMVSVNSEVNNINRSRNN